MANLLYPATTGHYVDDKYSALVEPNLWTNRPFQPNVTFTTKYQTGPAGQIFVHKPGVGTITATHPGADFSDAIVQDSLVPIVLDKQYSRSRKIYQATIESVAYNIAEAELETALEEIADAWQLNALDAVVLATGIVTPASKTALTKLNIYDDIVANRKKLVEKGARADSLIVSPEVYSVLLKSDQFQRVGRLGDTAIVEGMVGRIAGMNVFEYQGFNSYLPDSVVAGYTILKNDSVDYIMYDHDALSILTSLEAIRLVDEPTRFVGVLAQAQLVSGFKLTNVDRALVRYTEASTKTWTVHFDSDGGTPVETQYVANNGKVAEPDAPEKEGKTFSKWVLASDNSDWTFASSEVKKSITLKAIWT